jgi:hypothetical protein
MPFQVVLDSVRRKGREEGRKEESYFRNLPEIKKAGRSGQDWPCFGTSKTGLSKRQEEKSNSLVKLDQNRAWVVYATPQVEECQQQHGEGDCSPKVSTLPGFYLSKTGFVGQEETILELEFESGWERAWAKEGELGKGLLHIGPQQQGQMEVLPMQSPRAEGHFLVFCPSHQSKQAKTGDNPDG